MDQIDAKVFALITASTTGAVGLMKKLFPAWTGGKEEALALALPVVFTVIAKLLHAFQGTPWVDALLFSVGGGIGAGLLHDYVLNPVVKSVSSPKDEEKK